MEERKRRLEAEVERLQGELESLERDWKRLPYYAVLLVLAIPAGILWGGLAVALVIGGTATLIGTAAYLISVRKNEYRSDKDSVKRDIRTLEERS
ncbi:MAG: hypothetical protein ACOCV4_03855 [Myxococcota bacterium]